MIDEDDKFYKNARTIDGQAILPTGVVADLLGVTNQTLHRWQKSGEAPPTCTRPVKGYPARDLGDWIRTVQAHHPTRSGGVSPQHPSSRGSSGLPPAVPKKDLNTERIRKEAAQADKIEMENQVMAGLLVRIEDVEKGWSDILSRVKTRMMRIPHAAAQVVVGDDNLISVQRKIMDFVRDALNEMSADWREAEDEGDDD